MHKDCDVIDTDITAYEASQIMSKNKVGYIITGNGGTPEGIATEWDFVNKIVAKKLDPSTVKLSEIVSSPLTSVPSDTPMEKIATLMAKKSIRRLLVIDNGKLSGVITSRDILKFFDEYVSDIVEIASKFGIR